MSKAPSAILIVSLIGIGFCIFGFFALQQLSSAQSAISTPSSFSIPQRAVEASPEKVDPLLHLETPDEVRGFYWTAVSTGDPDRREALLDYLTTYHLNTVVIDTKMDDGEIAFAPISDVLQPFAQESPAMSDIESILRDLGERGIYRIARIPLMRDSALAVTRPDLALKASGGAIWRDKTGAAWIDPASPDVRDLALILAEEAYARGFDEVQFDYIRFPSDGALSTIQYPFFDANSSTKVEAMQDLFRFLGERLSDQGIPVSFDVFGMTFLSTYDMDIGQRLSDVYPYADYVSPMVYPSHYPAGFHGYQNPALYPYEVIKESLDEGARILANQFDVPEEESRPKFRPWIQDFDIGAIYTAERIEAQIKAVRDAGASGFILWNARNVYEPAQYIEPEVESQTVE